MCRRGPRVRSPPEPSWRTTPQERGHHRECSDTGSGRLPGVPGPEVNWMPPHRVNGRGRGLTYRGGPTVADSSGPPAKPLVDPLCLCGEPHPCRWHGRPEDVQPRLFEVPANGVCGQQPSAW